MRSQQSTSGQTFLSPVFHLENWDFCRSLQPDHRRRMFMSNLIDKIASKMVWLGGVGVDLIDILYCRNISLVKCLKYLFVLKNDSSVICSDSLWIQVENLHEVYSLLDGEEQAASCKLKESLDQLHQSNQVSQLIVLTVSYNYTTTNTQAVMTLLSYTRSVGRWFLSQEKPSSTRRGEINVWQKL